MATAIEALGMSLPYSSSSPADSEEKKKECEVEGERNVDRRVEEKGCSFTLLYRCYAVINNTNDPSIATRFARLAVGEAMKRLLELDLKPRDIMTKAAFENAIRMVMVTGGSTNAVLHLIAMSRSVQDPDVYITLDDFQRISDITPFLADLKPSGKYVMEDIQGIGGTPGLIKFMIDEGLGFDGDQMTVTGYTHSENLKRMNHPGLKEGQDIIRPVSDPIKKTGHLQMMFGNLCPGGGVAKITGKEGETFTGVAKVYDNEPAMMEGLNNKEIECGMVVIIRYEGPKGGPGLPEMLTPTSAIMGAGLGDCVALLTDGR